MTKWCGDLWGLVEVMVRRCSALLVLGLGEDEGLWVGIFGEHSEHSEQLGALGFFEGGDFWEYSEQLGAAWSTRILRMGIFWDYF